MLKSDEAKDEFDFSNPEEDRAEYEKRMELEKISREYQGQSQGFWGPYSKENSITPSEHHFFSLVIKTTLLVAFFPWSILVCVLIYGMEGTIDLSKAILRDLTVVVVGLLLGIISLVTIIILILQLFR